MILMLLNLLMMSKIFFYTLKAAFEADEGDGALICEALNDIARALEMNEISKSSGDA